MIKSKINKENKTKINKKINDFFNVSKFTLFLREILYIFLNYQNIICSHIFFEKLIKIIYFFVFMNFL